MPSALRASRRGSFQSWFGSLCALPAAFAFSIAGCPPEQSGTPTPATISTEDVAFGPEDLTEEAAEALAEVSIDIPTDRSQVILLGGGLLGGASGATAKLRDYSADSPNCTRTQIRNAVTFQELLWLNALTIVEFDEPKEAGPGDPNLNPEQPNGLAYVRGGKDYLVRSAPNSRDPNEVRCQKNLYGLDCSGFVMLCANGAGVPMPIIEAEKLNNPSHWNQRIPASWGVTMVRVPFVQALPDEPSTWTKMFTGDIAAFETISPDNPNVVFSHTAIVVETQSGTLFYNVAGSKRHTCEQSMEPHRGPTAWPMSALTSSKYPTLVHLLRLVPNNTLDALRSGEDNAEALLKRVDVLKAERTRDIAALTSGFAACKDIEDPAARSACQQNVIQQLKPGICARAEELQGLAYRAALLRVSSETLADLISTSTLASSFTFPDGQSCPCAPP